MKAVVELLMVVFGVIVGVNILIVFKDLELGLPGDKLYRISLIIGSSLGVYFLYRLYNFFGQQEEARLNKKVIQQTSQALTNPGGYELWPTLTCFLLLLLIFALMGLAPVYIGVAMLYKHHDDAMIILFVLIFVFGLFFGLGLLNSILLLVGKPVLRINNQGISHYMMELIAWHDVTGLYLQTVTVKGVKNHSLEIVVRNPEFYKYKHKNLLGRYFQRERISLHLPVSEENAKIAEAVATAYSKRSHRNKH